MIRAAALLLSTACVLSACSEPHTPGENQAAHTPSTEQALSRETQRLNAFFEDVFQADLARSPMRQTFLGLKTDYDKWDDASDAAAMREMQIHRANIAEMRERFDIDKLDREGALSYRLAEYELEEAERAFKYRHHAYLFNQMRGQHAAIPAFLINQHRIDDEADARAYLARLNAVPEFLGTLVAQSKTNAENGVMPPRFVYDYVIEAAENVINGYPYGGRTPTVKSPIYADFEAKIQALELKDETVVELFQEVRGALLNAVVPAYLELIGEMKRQRTLAGTDDGVWRLPDGENYYAARLANMTTTDMTAEQIHDLGLAEVDRLHAEMRSIISKLGFEGSLADFFDRLRTDPQFYKPQTEEGRRAYLAEATALIDTMRDALPRMFNRFPKADLIVKRVEPFREKGAGKAFYQRPAPDGSRPGIYYANLYNMAEMPVYQMEALAYHEGIPGHHMQIAIAQELEGLPKFRKFGGFTAYTEGWGLYSEFLPKELGFYQDPYSDFGRLAMELWRAARLVVDTGLHDKRWTREEATQYLIDNTPNHARDCQKAIDRYIVMPGQATAYKIGMLKILELRDRAKAVHGEDFQLADFHDIVLRHGPVPMAILEETIESWLSAQEAS